MTEEVWKGRGTGVTEYVAYLTAATRMTVAKKLSCTLPALRAGERARPVSYTGIQFGELLPSPRGPPPLTPLAAGRTCD